MSFQTAQEMLRQLKEAEGDPATICELLKLTGADLDALVSNTNLSRDEQIAVAQLRRAVPVGREAVIETIFRAAARAGGSGGRLLIVRGDSEVGKSSLLKSVRDRGASERLFVSGGRWRPPGDSPEPLRLLLWSIGDICRELGATATREWFDRWMKLLAAYEQALRVFTGAEALPVPVPANVARHRVFHALQSVIASLAAQRPVLLLLDDVQWADDLSLAFLRSLGEEFWSHTPVIVVVTERIGVQGDPILNFEGEPWIEELYLVADPAVTAHAERSPSVRHLVSERQNELISHTQAVLGGAVMASSVASLERLSHETIGLAQLWQELASGQYRIVEILDEGPRASVITQKSSIRLNPRLLAICEAVLSGAAVKTAAFDFSLSGSSVSHAVRTCLGELGVRTNASRVPTILSMAVIAHVNQLDVPAHRSLLEQEGSPYIVTSAALPSLDVHQFLTPATRAVAQMVIAGRTLTEIAEQRRTSPRTVANQLAATFLRLGVRDRRELLGRLMQFDARRPVRTADAGGSGHSDKVEVDARRRFLSQLRKDIA